MPSGFLFRLALIAIAAAASPPLLADTTGASRLSTLLGAEENAAYARAIQPREFDFPRDHGPHPEFRNEWWYVTGNLDGDDGRRLGFELTFFRFALSPEHPASDSAWRSNQVYIAHLAVTDAANERFYTAERYSRGALGLAGAQADPLRVWIDDWQLGAAAGRDEWRLVAQSDEIGIDLSLQPLKAPVLNGIDGLSQKSAEQGNASYYYSITRIDTQGRLRVADTQYSVSGLSWLDREWSSSALSAEQVGWDWFALQLDDGSELMFYGIRRADGTQDPHSAGTYVAADGSYIHVDESDVEIRVNDSWQSPAGGEYPSRWLLAVPKLGLRLDVTPVIADQELFTTVRYWEGAVDVVGTRDEQPVSGRGYVELTGYAD